MTESVQTYLPVKRIFHGIIETSDGRYIRILEIEPINFMLQSVAEQRNIMAAFASWLKISPCRLQFKVLTGKADPGRHVEGLKQDLTAETSDSCRALAKDYIRLIEDIGSKEALARRFFLIFEYESPHRSTDELSRIYGALQTAEQNATAYLAQCGNAVLQPRDPDEAAAALLYTFFNRRSCITEPFASRINRVVVDVMAASRRTIGVDPIPDIPITNLIAPRGMDFSHSSYIVMDGMYFCFLMIRANGYPNVVRAGWTTALENLGEGVDVDIHLRREDRSKTMDRISQRLRLNRSKIKGMQDTGTDYEELESSIQAGYYIKQSIANRNEDLFYMSILLTVSARSREEMNWRRQQVTDLLKSMDISVSFCRFCQEAAFRSAMPFLFLDAGLERRARRNVLTGGAASVYPYASYEISDDNGVLLGINRYNRSFCILDFFDAKKHKNGNLNIVGTSGSGKTFAMQLLALRMRIRGVQCFILAPIKGHEFYRACSRIGGAYVKIAPGSRQCINVMEIRHTVTPMRELTDDGEDTEPDSMLALKIQQLLIFFSLLIPDITNEEEQLLDEALIRTYEAFGITHDNRSLYADEDAVPPKMKPMPVLGDLYRILRESPGTERIAVMLARFVTGSAQSFNQQTNVNLENPYVVLDLSDLKGKLLPVGMMIALDYVWDTIKSDILRKKAIFIDEIWQLVGAGSNRLAAEFCLTIFKTIRGFGGIAVSATQDLSDFFGLDDGKYGRAILNSSQNKMILNLEPDEAKSVQEILKLSGAEVDAISRFERGEALLCSGVNRVPISVKASPTEHDLITTDRSELEILLREAKKEKYRSEKY